MKYFWILRYLLRLGTLNIGTKINVENLYTPNKLIQNDISLRVNQLAKDHLNIDQDFAYRTITKQLSKNLWHAQIRIKKSSQKSIKLNLIYKLGKNSKKVLLIK